MDHNSTNKLTNALQSIATLNNKERDLLIAALGIQQTIPNTTTKIPSVSNVPSEQQFINSLIKSHPKTVRRNQQRLNNIKNTRKIVRCFPEATTAKLS